VKGESTHHSRDNLVATFSANKLSNKEGFFGTSNPFLKLYRYERKCRVIFCGGGLSLLCWCYLLLRQLFTIAALVVRFYGLKIIFSPSFSSTTSTSALLFLFGWYCYIRCNEDGTYTLVWQNSRIDSCLNPRWSQTVRTIDAVGVL
jgi:hypothetical protein